MELSAHMSRQRHVEATPLGEGSHAEGQHYRSIEADVCKSSICDMTYWRIRAGSVNLHVFVKNFGFRADELSVIGAGV